MKFLKTYESHNNDDLFNKIISLIDENYQEGVLFNFIKQYIDSGCDPDRLTTKEDTIITSLIEKYYKDDDLLKEMIQYLFDNGADPNYISSFNMNYLVETVDFERFKLIELFIENDVFWTIPDDDGDDFLSYLKYKSLTEYERIIKKYPEKYKKYMRGKQARKFKI